MDWYLFGDGVPVKVGFTDVHPLLVQEFALVGNKESVTHKLANCKQRKQPHVILSASVFLSQRWRQERMG